MASLYSLTSASGAPSNVCASALSVRMLRNTEQPYIVGRHLSTVCTASGRVPMGRYIPPMKPTSVPISVAKPDHAPSVLTSEAAKYITPA